MIICVLGSVAFYAVVLAWGFLYGEKEGVLEFCWSEKTLERGKGGVVIEQKQQRSFDFS